MAAAGAAAAVNTVPGDEGRIEVEVLHTDKPRIAVVDYRMGNLKSVERGLQGVGADAFITEDARQIVAADAVVLPGVGAFADAAASMNDLGQMDAIRSAIADGAPFLGICLGMQLLFSDGVEGASEDAPAHGLGLIQGTCRRMPKEDAQGNRYKVPHVGWNSIEAPLGAGMTGKPLLKTECNLPNAEVGGLGEPSMLKQSSLGGMSTGHSIRCETARGGSPQSPADSSRSELSIFSGIPEGEFFYFTHSYIAPDTPRTIAETVHSVRFPSAVQVGDRVFGVQFHPEKSSDAGAHVLGNFVRIVRRLRGIQ